MLFDILDGSKLREQHVSRAVCSRIFTTATCAEEVCSRSTITISKQLTRPSNDPGEVVNVFIGTRKFTIHTSNLRKHSTWFTRRLGTSNEDITFPNTVIRLSIFTAFFDFVYDRPAQLPTQRGCWNHFWCCLTFAKDFGSPSFVKEILKRIVRAAAKYKAVPRHELISVIYNQTHEGASLRRLMRDMVIWDGGCGYFPDGEYPMTVEMVQFVYDVAAELQASRGRKMDQNSKPYRNVASYAGDLEFVFGRKPQQRAQMFDSTMEGEDDNDTVVGADEIVKSEEVIELDDEEEESAFVE